MRKQTSAFLEKYEVIRLVLNNESRGQTCGKMATTHKSIKQYQYRSDALSSFGRAHVSKNQKRVKNPSILGHS